MSAKSEHIVQIAPNSSLSDRGTLLFFLSMLAATGVVTLPLAALGFWPVLPFAGIEMAVLGAALLIVRRRQAYREVVRVCNRKIVVEKGEKTVQERLEFARHWARVELRSGATDQQASRLWISAHGRRCELGRCLSEPERAGLARRLRELIGPMSRSPALAG